MQRLGWQMKPTVQLDSIDCYNSVIEIERNMPETIYQRKGNLVRVVSVKEDNNTNNDKLVRHSESLVIREVTIPILKMELMNNITFLKLAAKNRLTQCVIDNNTLQMISDLGTYPNVNVINGISEIPFMRADGTICETPGFDKQSGVFYNPSCNFPKIPLNPTEQDAKSAYSRLEYIFSDFPFTRRYYSAVPIALMLSVITRPMTGNVPLPIVEASSPGSGKTLMFDTCSIICFGRVTPKQSWPEGKDNNGELDKILSAIALDATQFVVFDNVGRESYIGGAALDKVLTCNGSVKFRILGKSQVPELPWNTILAMTGNNAIASIKGDTKRRVLPCRIEPNVENPESRSEFKEKNLLDYCYRTREQSVVDLLIMTRYWHNIGRPEPDKLVGSFESWSRVVGGTIKACSGIDIVECMLSMQEIEDTDYTQIYSLLETLNECFISGFLSADIVRACEDNSRLKRDMDAVIYGKRDLTARIVGKFLNKINGRIYGDFKLVDTGKKIKRSVLWNVIKVEEKKQAEFNIDSDSAF